VTNIKKNEQFIFKVNKRWKDGYFFNKMIGFGYIYKKRGFLYKEVLSREEIDHFKILK